MPYEIIIQPAGVHFQSDRNLLDDALKQSVPLAHSCKTGDCGICTAEIISGEVENEKGIIVKSGDVLVCQSKALSNTTLKAFYHPELVGQKEQTVPCKVDSFSLVTDDVMVIRFRFPATVKFNYLPGQYVDLSFKGIKRSYSIANAKQVSTGIELHIRKVLNGQMSNALFSGIKKGQLMRVEGPKGTFFIRQSKRPLILLAGGTGIAPVKAMVEELICNQDKRDIHIYWGMSLVNSFYLQELAEISEKNSHIYYTPVLSGDGDWNGRTGFVHQAVCDDFLSMQDFQVYACGSPLMINAARAAFNIKGLSSEQFFSDAFTPAE
ncbi:FAD-binding oxidoreductase [Amphritea sp.]|uniref:FAD-binding oxidoreductase n=1 Tax=Amphritea sp. TaxID=1872502 RepID=UPI0025C3D4CB|nr:FAD-binding oxidoreductase [Amphritea sp.]